MQTYSFKVSPKDAVVLQHQLKHQVQLVPLHRAPLLIGGCDVSMQRFAKEGYGGFVTLSYPELTLMDHAVVKSSIPFPYIPMLVEAWEKLTIKPEVIVVDGNGIAHPRRLGIASHLGLVLDVPTVGCAKSLLIGSYQQPDNMLGAYSYIVDKKQPLEVIGAAVRTKVNVKPVFVSAGHRITLEESIELVLSSVRKHRLPEETRLAHATVNKYRVGDENG